MGGKNRFQRNLNMLKWIKSFFNKPRPDSGHTVIDSIDPDAVTVLAPVSNSVKLGQFMTTNAMRKELRDLGYTKFQIDALTPDEAANRINNQEGPKR